MSLRLFLLRNLTSVQKLMQKIGNPEPQVSTEVVERIVSMAESGDVILTRENWKLTNIFVPKYWGHAAIVYNNRYVIEAIGDYKTPDGIKNGVRIENLQRFLFQKDSVVLLRPKFCDIEQKKSATVLAYKCIGLGYNYVFAPNEKSFYCSELITWCYDKIIKPSPFTLREQFGVITSTPQDFYDAKEKFQIIFEERND